ncbi:uncharacterized protein Z519_05980 [Cladophialophora bantiana CBS 173.52]|uniref:Uncharacterized protein n=1 Tax=Cladophialophora bantiana (strain ATCC 10958 / CBS 173.52 / CDC B-1940 / NIH 8579) TaxID=1442370 RepID=A0A0D2HRA3_CLAB1|nr:uncharacterized protein Z519_05980 [Cladophialophora bantiana CBS 173.52]KIW93375.1 hypothetical protein Z519_05980 [Cladophialophora bantiana CBS 173.52]
MGISTQRQALPSSAACWIEEDTGESVDVKDEDGFGQFLEDRGVEMVGIDVGLELPLAQIDPILGV